jgi:hypothetical protein
MECRPTELEFCRAWRLGQITEADAAEPSRREGRRANNAERGK